MAALLTIIENPVHIEIPETKLQALEIGRIITRDNTEATDSMTAHINDKSIHTTYDALDWAAFDITLQGL